MIEGLQTWHWLVLGLLLGSGELLFSGAYCLWISIAALLTAVFNYFLGGTTTATTQVLIFGGLSLVLVLIGQKVFPKNYEMVGDNYLNRRADKLIGQIFVLDQPIINGRGHIKVGDLVWTVLGDTLEVGEKVRVVSIDGTFLVVEKIEL